MVVYVGLEDVVEGGVVVVVELKIFSFVGERRTSRGGRTTGTRRTFGAWAISGTG